LVLGHKGKEGLSKLLEVADELMQHVQKSESYQKLSDEQKVKAFRALLDEYTSSRS
jgi:hypothetical protein